jgi:hypothetical protein
MNEADVHGPIDTTVIEFPEGSSGAETANALLDLVETGVIRLYDLMVVRRAEDGWEVIDLAVLPDELGELLVFAGARSGLLDLDDAAAVAEVIRPGYIGVVLVYENAWAGPFVAAARAAGGEMVASTRITADEVIDALDALEASESAR